MGIVTKRQLKALRCAPRPYRTFLSIALISLCARFVSAAILTTGNVNPDPSTTTTSDDLYVGQSADGTLLINQGSNVSSAESFLGHDAGVTGAATITGVNSHWDAEDLWIGVSGIGNLAILDGATLTSEFFAVLGTNPGSHGIALVSGQGSTWTHAGTLNVAAAGTAQLTIQDGAIVSSTTGLIGHLSGQGDRNEGTVLVTGANSRWVNATSLPVFVGRLAIEDGAQVSVGEATHVSQTNTGDAQISFDNGTFSTGTLFAAPEDLVGTGTINTRGIVSNIELLFDQSHGPQQQILLASGPNQDIRLNLDLDGTAPLGVGHRGTGSLTIRDGARIATKGGFLGYTPGSTGTAVVTGAGSRWDVASPLRVGHLGTGELLITDGAAVNTNSFASIGYFFDANGSVTVTGENSTFTSQLLRVGERGRGELTIADGARVTASSSEIGSEGGSPLNDAAEGTVTVAGAGTSWITNDTLGIGARGKAELSIADGGLVTCTDGYIAVYGEPSSDDSEGTVSVTGDGSRWTVSNRLDISGSGGPVGGVGTLVIGDGGLVRTGFVTNVGPKGLIKLDGGTFASSILSFHSPSAGGFEWTSGTLHVGRFGRRLTNSAGILAPGESIGSTIIEGSYTQESAGTLQIELGGAAADEFDVVTVNGAATLGGTLDVRLVDLGAGIFSPAAGDTFEILTATGGIVNRFDEELLPALDDLAWLVNYGPNAVSLTVMLPGDFNGDFVVDAADYVAWRKAGGLQDGYDAWRTNFGRTAADGGSAASVAARSAVPEPSTIILIMASCLAAGGMSRNLRVRRRSLPVDCQRN
jgi:T5SS/PEP-CTERM-associated repeat protein